VATSENKSVVEMEKFKVKEITKTAWEGEKFGKGDL
jgi:hypothetical protein